MTVHEAQKILLVYTMWLEGDPKSVPPSFNNLVAALDVATSVIDRLINVGEM